MNKSALKILQDFDAAAPGYDRLAKVQADIASHLVEWAGIHGTPEDILDIGSGTGFVSELAAKRYPLATITALDHAPAMLAEAKRKLPRLKTIMADAARAEIAEKFDVIFSSMMLHWLPKPADILKRWQTWLKPNGQLYVAFLIKGSFREWDDLCRQNAVESGLWAMPEASLADDLAVRREAQNLSLAYPSARDFLHQLKAIGAGTPHQDHRPLSSASMRRILAYAPRPFHVTYCVLYAALESPEKSG